MATRRKTTEIQSTRYRPRRKRRAAIAIAGDARLLQCGLSIYLNQCVAEFITLVLGCLGHIEVECEAHHLRTRQCESSAPASGHVQNRVVVDAPNHNSQAAAGETSGIYKVARGISRLTGSKGVVDIRKAVRPGIES